MNPELRLTISCGHAAALLKIFQEEITAPCRDVKLILLGLKAAEGVDPEHQLTVALSGRAAINAFCGGINHLQHMGAKPE